MLQELAGQARAGDATFAIIRGAAGLGKSRLLTEFWTSARDSGPMILATSCEEHAAEDGYRAVRGLFAPLGLTSRDSAEHPLLLGNARWALDVLAPETREPEPGASDYRALHGLYWLVVNLTADRALMLIVDDVHWCDKQSLRCLDYLLRRADGLPLSVVLAQRTGVATRATEVVADMIGQHPCTVVDLPPLEPTAVAELIRHALARQPEEEFVHACWEVCGGNPLLLHQLLDELSRSDVQPDHTGMAQVTRVGQDVVGTTVLTRLAQHPDHVRKVAEAVAVLGDVQADLLGALTGLTDTKLTDAVHTLRESGLLTAAGTSFRHDVLRRTVLADIPNARLMALRARAAQVQSDMGQSADDVAAQLMRLPELTEKWMLDILREAASRAMRNGVPELAVRYLRRILDTGKASPNTLRLELANALSKVDPFEALPLFREVLDELPEARARASIAVQYSMVALAARKSTEAIEVLCDVLKALRAEAGPAPATADQELLTLLESSLLMVGAAMTATLDKARRYAATLRPPPGHTPAERRMLVSMAGLASIEARPAAEVAELARRAVGTSGGSGWDLVSPAMVLWMTDDTDEALAVFERALDDSRNRGDAWMHHITLAARALTLHGIGNLAEAEADAQTAIDITEQAPWQRVSSMPFQALAAVQIERGETAQAAQSLRRVEESSSAGFTWSRPLFFMHAAQVRYDEGDLEGAWRFLQQCKDSAEEVGLANPFLPWRTTAACVLTELGRPAAIDIAKQALELGRGYATARAIGAGLIATGVAVGGRRGVELLTESVATLAESPARLLLARAHYYLGYALLDIDDAQGARKHLHESVNLAVLCGAVALGDTARKLLVQAGGRIRVLARTPLDLLTGSERRVTTMAAEGHSNRHIAEALFITLRTVEAHLTNAYRKLGIAGRADLKVLLDTSVNSAMFPDESGPQS